jgi:hypothetical protein
MLRFGLAVFVTLLASPAFACSIPVFRYALEQWPPSPYQLVVYHQGALSKDDRATFQKIADAARRANVEVSAVDLENAEPGQKAVWEREGKGIRMPRVLLRYPLSEPEFPSVWSGPLAIEPVVALFDSPARRAVFDRLTLGNAGVGVLLLSGDQPADDAARAMLSRELPRIAARIELPARSAEGPQIKSDVPLRVAFPVVEVRREPQEELLVQMLVGSEDGLAAVRGPIVFPVFGRGRALCSLHGKDLEKPGELQRSLEYLCRACSCQVKELNPGVDLLIAGNWDSIFDAEKGPAPRVVSLDANPPRAETRTSAAGGPGRSELRSAPPLDYAAVEVNGDPSPSSSRSPWLRYGTVAALGFVCVTGFWALRGRRPNGRS